MPLLTRTERLSSKSGFRVNRTFGDRKVSETDGWFIGYAPADVPRFAVAVVVEGGTSGGTSAAPIARRIMEAVAAGLPAPEPQPEEKGASSPH